MPPQKQLALPPRDTNGLIWFFLYSRLVVDLLEFVFTTICTAGVCGGNKPISATLFVMLENPKINKDLIYEYRGVKTKAPYNTSGWNSVYVAGKIIEKIGPILAINNKEFTDLYVVEKFN